MLKQQLQLWVYCKYLNYPKSKKKITLYNFVCVNSCNKPPIELKKKLKHPKIVICVKLTKKCVNNLALRSFCP